MDVIGTRDEIVMLTFLWKESSIEYSKNHPHKISLSTNVSNITNPLILHPTSYTAFNSCLISGRLSSNELGGGTVLSSLGTKCWGRINYNPHPFMANSKFDKLARLIFVLYIDVYVSRMALRFLKRLLLL